MANFRFLFMCGILCQAVQTVAACIRAGGVSSFKLGEVIRLSRCFCGLHFCSKVWVAGGDDRNRFGVGFGVVGGIQILFSLVEVFSCI